MDYNEYLLDYQIQGSFGIEYTESFILLLRAGRETKARYAPYCMFLVGLDVLYDTHVHYFCILSGHPGERDA